MNEYLVSLAQEYLDLIDKLGSGMFSREDMSELDKQRQTTHYQLCDVLKVPHSHAFDMYSKAVEIVNRSGKGERSWENY